MATRTRPKPSAVDKAVSRAKRIALFNHKGGVSKTTTTFNLGWMLASKGHRVVMVDADPQCNLSGLVLGYKGQNEFESFYENQPQRNIRAGLSPAFESRPKEIEAIECVPVEGNTNLFLLPGHIRLSEYEVSLGMAQELSGTIQTLQNLPGSLSYLLEKTGQRYRAEFILIDLNPSLSSINQNLVMTSDFFIVPASPDYFSVMAIDSLTTVFPRWRAWARQASSMSVFRDATYPLPTTIPKFLGTIIQKYRIRVQAGHDEEELGAPSSGTPAMGFQKWIDEINSTVRKKFVPMLRREEMMLDDQKYRQQGIEKDYCLASVSEFNSLIAKSQEHQVPVYQLTDQQIGLTGVVLERTLKSKNMFEAIFNKLGEMVVELTSDAVGT
ncbi:ParA family protein [Tautonia marina]|uniref:ParA family protein n=1 Tax=Tautonia marina TaxID=2653855 RepID=UPI0012610662|nr:AAA family ATPase [Tautonia marina]